MKRHTKVYLQGMGYDMSDTIPCEVCEARAVDIHHIKNRGMGGDPTGSKDEINNLMALCRSCHDRHGDVPNKREWLREIHAKRILQRNAQRAKR